MIRDLIRFLSNTAFPQILEMTVIASIVILAVIIVRFFIRKSPKVFSYLLWSVVLFRLLCPISFSTNMSMFNLKLFDVPMVHEVQNIAVRNETTNNVQTADVPQTAAVANDISETNNATTTVDNTVNTVNTTDNRHSINSMSVATTVWFAGMLLLFITNLVSFLKLKIKTAACLKVRDNIYIADEIDSPFCLGFVHPKIYLPSSLKEREMEYIIIHEQTHIRRMDHIVKMLAFVALIVHWFNPLVWLAFILACKDIEMSCDETVLKKMKGDIRQEYCMSILQLATRKRISLVSPLSFADGDPKRRIKNVMNYKKPGIGIIILSVLICTIAGVGLSSNAKTNADHDAIAENTENTIDQEPTNTNENTDTLQELKDEQVINEYLHGFCVPTDMNISNIKYYLFNNTLEIHFVYDNNVFLVARIAEGDSYKDISDEKYPWTSETDELTLKDRPTHTVSYFSDKESIMLITWFEANKGVNVSLEARGQDLNGFDLFAVAERMLPKDDTAETSTDEAPEATINAAPETTKQTVDTTGAGDTNISSQPTESGAYKSVLDSAYDIVSGTNIDVVADDDTMGLIESSAGNATEALANIGYCILDIDEDGTSELLIVDNSDGDNRILDIYSLDENGKTLFLAGGWARNKFYLNGKNNIVNIGSGGADSTVYMTYQVGEASINLVPTECYFTDYADENREQLGWYHNANGGAVKEDSEWIGDAYDDSLTAEIQSKYANHYEFDLTYFKDYQK